MKKLTLIRHAKSSWKYPELSDFDRPLNKRGKRDLPEMAQRVVGFEIFPNMLISSGAKRAITTAQALKVCLELTNDQFQVQPELYDSLPETLLYVLQNQPEHLKHIMLVGHNPGLEMLGQYLTNTQLIKFPTAAIMHIHLSITSWEELSEDCGSLIRFDAPSMHRN